ncbi:MAG: UbiA family prenyltransferase [Gammaproteobacteria bacterium]|nr:UbiA family prenyltransferase [Gammaproteobacteria bacterium]
MPNSISQPTLYVDLDGTVIKTDLLFESILLLFKKNILQALLIPIWLIKGKANLKHQLSKRVHIPVELLPLNTEFHSYLKEEVERGRNIVLISASSQLVVRQVSDHLGLFIDAMGSDEETNLKSKNKVTRILQLDPAGGFIYAGNSKADIAVWLEASEVILVNCKNSLAENLQHGSEKIQHFDTPKSTMKKFWQAIRPHQWLKNALIFLPLILSHQLNQPNLLLQACVAFLSFSLVASSVYLLNDMLDLNSDRQHHSKSRRPFASGDLSLAYGYLGVPLLLALGFLIALWLPTEFIAVLLTYWLMTTLYSLLLKSLFLIDVLTLASLYTWRIIAGSAAISVVTTYYLLAFSFFLFLGLAMVKRYTEFLNLQNQGKSTIEGRGYGVENLQTLAIIGGSSSLIAVAVFAFYITAPATTELYSNPLLLWGICPLLLYLLWRIWALARRGKLDEDPVLFALTDRRSQLTAALCGLIIWLAI